MEPVLTAIERLNKRVREKFQARLDSFEGATRPYRHLFRHAENERVQVRPRREGDGEQGGTTSGLFTNRSLHINWKRMVNREKGDYDTFLEHTRDYIETFVWKVYGTAQTHSAVQVAGRLNVDFWRLTLYMNYITAEKDEDGTAIEGTGLQLVLTRDGYKSNYIPPLPVEPELDEPLEIKVVELTEFQEGSADSDGKWTEAADETLHEDQVMDLILARAAKDEPDKDELDV